MGIHEIIREISRILGFIDIVIGIEWEIIWTKSLISIKTDFLVTIRGEWNKGDEGSDSERVL